MASQDTPNGDGYAHNFDRRLDRINDTIVALTDSMAQMRDYLLETHKLATIRHEQTMEEIRELIELPKDSTQQYLPLLTKARNRRQ